jgi:hypothetical protein
MGGYTLQGALEYAHEYFSQEESVESSTFQKLLGVLWCLKSMILLREGKFVVFHVYAQNLLGIINRGGPRLKLNKLARECFWFGDEHSVTLSGEWVSREHNSLADETAKLIIPGDWMLVRSFFRRL